MEEAVSSIDKTVDGLRRARELYRDLIGLYRSQMQSDRALECIQMAVKHELWRDPAQRPIDYHPGLTASPVHDASKFPVCEFLEAEFDTMRADLAMLENPQCEAFFPVEEPLLTSGRWEEAIFYEGGLRYERTAKRFPGISSVVDRLPDQVRQCGMVMLSRLAPDSHIFPHCGFTNSRLRLHLGLVIPGEAMMRVADRFVEWKQGKCVVFDDSFEHEVWHFGTSPRIVLLIDIPHPEITARTANGRTRQLNADFQDFMRQRGLRRIEQAKNTGELSLELDEYHSRLVKRLMTEMNVDSVVLEERKD